MKIKKLAKITLPWPPTVNHYWIQRGPRKFVGTKGREFRIAVRQCIESYYDNLGQAVPKYTGKLGLLVSCYQADRRKRDLDNLFKSLLDAITHSELIEDDSQFDQLAIFRDGFSQPPKVNILLYEVLP